MTNRLDVVHILALLWIGGLVLLGTTHVGTPHAPVTMRTEIPVPPLDAMMVERLFEDLQNDDYRPYALHVIGWSIGSYTASGVQEALVSVHDGNQCHAARMGELWLLRFEEGWQLGSKIDESDGVYYDSVDVDGDGVDEIWIERIWGNQGYEHIEGEVIRLQDEKRVVLYTYTGHDYRGAGVSDDNDQLMVRHDLEFFDQDGDGLLEMRDTTYTITCAQNEDGTEQEEVLSTSESVHRLRQGGFVGD